MDYQDPPLDWQREIHERIVAREPTAFAELCQRALRPLLSALQASFPKLRDDPILETVLHDVLIDYDQQPHKFDPSRADLFSYLRMVARDDVRNARAKRKRRLRRLEDFDDRPVELIDTDGYIEREYFDIHDWVAEFTDLPVEMVIGGLRDELDDAEMQAFLLMLGGVRETERYAPLLGIENRDIETQRREVKRLKDRVKKRVERYGKRIRRDK